MRALSRRVEELARKALTRRAEHVAANWGELLPKASVSVSDGNVAIEAKGLMRRWLTKPALRFVGRSR